MTIASKKAMKWMAWGAALLLIIVISNNASNELTITLRENVRYILGFVAIAMLLCGLLIASHLKSGSYITFISLIGLVPAMQFSTFVPSEQTYCLIGIGMLAFMRVTYPILVSHRDEQPVAPVTRLHDHSSGKSSA